MLQTQFGQHLSRSKIFQKVLRIRSHNATRPRIQAIDLKVSFLD